MDGLLIELSTGVTLTASLGLKNEVVLLGVYYTLCSLLDCLEICFFTN